MPVMPHQSLQDSQYFRITPENPAMMTEVEGGYTFSRPSHTRTPRRTFTTGFTDLTDQQRLDLEAFWNTVRGSSDAFDWTHPVDGTTHSVRFKKDTQWQFVYRGKRLLRRWDLPNVQLEEV